jgi:hypothetical protein
MPVTQTQLTEITRKNRVQLVRPAYVSYGHPNLNEAERFAKDFGLVDSPTEAESTIPVRYFRGYGDQPLVYVVVQTDAPEFLGVTFEAQSMEDLKKAAAIPGASKIEKMDHQPGGGQRVTIRDPDNLPFHVIFGQKLLVRIEPTPQVDPFNYPAQTDEDTDKKPRRGRFQRPQRGPAPVHKLGHCGYVVSDLWRSVTFYTTHFSFAKSDSVANPIVEGESALVFLHVDKGKFFTDHHAFFLAVKMPDQQLGPHHAAFEVHDFDVQQIAHYFLKSKGYKPQWGVGRHRPGSQIFDYWFDLSGFVLEHYCDGDLVNEDTTFREYHLGETDSWGPETPFL